MKGAPSRRQMAESKGISPCAKCFIKNLSAKIGVMLITLNPDREKTLAAQAYRKRRPMSLSKPPFHPTKAQL